MITIKCGVRLFPLILLACLMNISRSSHPVSPSLCELDNFDFLDLSHTAASQPSLCSLNPFDAIETNINASEDRGKSDSSHSDISTTLSLASSLPSPSSSTPLPSSPSPISPDHDRLRQNIIYLSLGSFEIVVNLRQSLLNRFFQHNRLFPTTPCFYRKRPQQSYIHPQPGTNFEARLREDCVTAENYLRYFQRQLQHRYNMFGFNHLLWNLMRHTERLLDNLRKLLRLLNIDVSAHSAMRPRDRCYESSHIRLVFALMNMEDYLKYYIPSDLRGLYGSQV